MCVESKSGTHKTLDGLGQYTGQNKLGLVLLEQNWDRKETGYRECDNLEYHRVFGSFPIASRL